MPEQQKKKNPGGRPTLYKPEYCQMIIDFFNISVDDYRNGEKEFPTLADFAHEIGFSKSTLHDWRKNHKEFSDAYKKAEELREAFFVKAGMQGALNTTFAIFYSKNCLGWKDKQEIDQTVNLAGSLKINVVKKDGKKK